MTEAGKVVRPAPTEMWIEECNGSEACILFTLTQGSSGLTKLINTEAGPTIWPISPRKSCHFMKGNHFQKEASKLFFELSKLQSSKTGSAETHFLKTFLARKEKLLAQTRFGTFCSDNL